MHNSSCYNCLHGSLNKILALDVTNIKRFRCLTKLLNAFENGMNHKLQSRHTDIPLSVGFIAGFFYFFWSHFCILFIAGQITENHPTTVINQFQNVGI